MEEVGFLLYHGFLIYSRRKRSSLNKISLPPMDNTQTCHLDRSIRHIWLCWLRTLHNLVPCSNRYYRRSPCNLNIIVGCASNVSFDAEQYILREGEEATNFYIIHQGKVALEIFTSDRGPITIQTIGEGDVLGWSWLIPPYHWHYDARAIEPTSAIALDAKCLRAKCEEDHDLGYELLKRFAHVISQKPQTNH